MRANVITCVTRKIRRSAMMNETCSRGLAFTGSTPLTAEGGRAPSALPAKKRLKNSALPQGVPECLGGKGVAVRVPVDVVAGVEHPPHSHRILDDAGQILDEVHAGLVGQIPENGMKWGLRRTRLPQDNRRLPRA